MRRLAGASIAALLILFGGSAAAHEMSMAELQLRETSPGTFIWQWTATALKARDDEVRAVWPDSCAEDLNFVRCGEAGLAGRLGVEGVGESYSAALIRIYWLDGQASVHTLTAAQPSVQLFGSADDRRGMGEIARAYTVLGVEHILNGFDHLLFVFALLFLVGFNRQLVLTITAFTLAHSLTLALSALGLLALRSPPVEASIALSIMLVAGEALGKERTLARRWPALVALLFGLVHGLGFAGALREIGLPENNLLVALLTFNAGVEIGQLMVVGAAFLLLLALRRVPSIAMARVPAVYAMGAVAAYWSIGRIVAIFA